MSGRATAALSTPNQICADWHPRRPGVDVYCSSTTDVGAVYTEARTRARGQAGTLAVWVHWPAGEGQENDPAKLAAWFDQARRVLSFLENGSDLALLDRSIKALEAQKAQMLTSQNQLVNHKRAAIDDTLQAIKDKVAAGAADPRQPGLAAALADARLRTAELQATLGRTRAALTALQPEYERLVDEFKAYRASEPAFLARMTQFATDASSADLPQLAKIKVEVGDYEQAIGSAPNTLRVHAQAVRAKALAAQSEYETAIEPHRGYMAGRGLKVASFVDTTVRSTGSMLAYCESRHTAVEAAFAKLQDGLRARTDALVELSADEATRDTLANARFADASTDFLAASNKRIAQLWATPATSPKLAFPLYTAQHEAFLSFVQLEPLCSAAALASSSWMKAGCSAMQPSFTRAHAWLASTLPNALKMRVALLRRKGANADLCTEIETQIAAGHVTAAVTAYDAAVRLTDPETSP